MLRGGRGGEESMGKEGRCGEVEDYLRAEGGRKEGRLFVMFIQTFTVYVQFPLSA